MRRGKSTNDVLSESYMVWPAGTGTGSRPCRGFGRCLKKRRQPAGVIWPPRAAACCGSAGAAGGGVGAWVARGPLLLTGGGGDGGTCSPGGGAHAAASGEAGGAAGGDRRGWLGALGAGLAPGRELPLAEARSISSGMEERTVSSAGSLAFASKSKSPSAHARAETTASSPAAPSPTAWKRWPKRKYRVVALLPFWRSVNVPVARSAWADSRRARTLVSASDPLGWNH